MAGGGADEESTLLLATDTTSAPPAAVDNTSAPPDAAKPKRPRKVLTDMERKHETEKRGMWRKRTKSKAKETHALDLRP